MQSDPEFCDRCGQPAKSHGKPCRQAQYLSVAQITEGTVVRCPVRGCQFRLDSYGRSKENARSTFYSHLEWHERQGLVPGTCGPEEASAPAQSEARTLDEVRRFIASALPHMDTSEIDWPTWSQEVVDGLHALPEGPRNFIARAVLLGVRGLEGAQW